LPEAASDFSAAIAEKSLVNDDVEMLGAGAAELLLAAADAVLVLELELELLDELPQAATPTLAVMASAATIVLLFSKCTLTSSSSSANDAVGAHAARSPLSGWHNDVCRWTLGPPA
jgi:hypothetical protein